jgi:hypothetical protein
MLRKAVGRPRGRLTIICMAVLALIVLVLAVAGY